MRESRVAQAFAQVTVVLLAGALAYAMLGPFVIIPLLAVALGVFRAVAAWWSD
jgi:hypothetical protein